MQLPTQPLPTQTKKCGKNTDCTVNVTVQEVQEVSVNVPFFEYKKFSKWRKLIRVTAYVERFVRNIKARYQQGVKGEHSIASADGPLSCQELNKAERLWVITAQESLKNQLAKGEFKQLSLFIDPDGVIRVGGRVDKAIVLYETSHAALLPHKNWISLLITRHMHQCGHPGVAVTAAKVKVRYWILRAHDLAKSVKFRCVTCRKIEHKTKNQLMAELPRERLLPNTPPFYTYCDYFGPYAVKIGRNSYTKHYRVIFICLNTRAVHLELAVDCSTMEFMQQWDPVRWS